MAWVVKAWVRVSEEHISEEVHETVESFVGPFESKLEAECWRTAFLKSAQKQNISAGVDEPVRVDLPWLNENMSDFLRGLKSKAQEALRDKLGIADELPF